MKRIILSALFLLCSAPAWSQIVERERPAEWDNLVNGAKFMDRFEPMPAGEVSSDVWGAQCVLPRLVSNGIESPEYSFWGGNIVKESDDRYHMYICGWPENSPKGHWFWPHSSVYHAVADNTIGPFTVVERIGDGHNPEMYQLADGRYVLYVIKGYYISDSLDGPWERYTFEFDTRSRGVRHNMTNFTFAQREDGSYIAVCKGGGIWISRTGVSPYRQITDKRVYPDVDGRFEDPVIWHDDIQYHLIVNDWLGRIAFYQRSKDGINWVTDPGEAYVPGFSVHEDGTKEDWFKYERIKIYQDDHGRAIQANFAVIDTLKHEDLENDIHSSKNISVPLNKGMLMTILDAAPITADTKTIRVKIAGEPDFDPTKELNIKSLRFGASQEVNYGRGSRVISSEKDGRDLILTFAGEGNGITEDEFAPKLIGEKKNGKMVFAFARLPYVQYETAIVSSEKPEIYYTVNGTFGDVEVENFGLITSQKSDLVLYVVEGDTKTAVATAAVPSLEPYERVVLPLAFSSVLDRNTKYAMQVEISCKGETLSTFDFSMQEREKGIPEPQDALADSGDSL